MVSTNKVFLFGLDNAGKTTLLKYVKDGAIEDDPMPTMNFSIESMIMNDIDFRIWDAPGQIRYRELWGKGLDSANICWYVLDTSTGNRFDEAKAEFDKIMNDPETRTVPLIFCFHKMDLEASQKNILKAEVTFKLHTIRERKVTVFKTTKEDTDGLNKVKEKLVELVEQARFG